MSNYDSMREQIYKDVHDDKSRLLEAAECDIQILNTQIARLKERIVGLESALNTATAFSRVTALHTEFAERLTELCYEYAMCIAAGACELEGQLLLEGTLVGEIIVPVWRSGSGGYIQLDFKKEVCREQSVKSR